MQENYILEMKGITKCFPGVTALSDVHFNCKRGEIHALMGENGAGKSTLIKLLGGHSFPTEGEIFYDGGKFDVKTPHQSMERGIAIIYQELNLVKELDAVENIFLGREIKRGIFIDYQKMKEKATAIMESIGMRIDMSLPMNRLSIAQQQMVEIAKALSMNAKFIIMDEPTATLTSHEVESLFHVMQNLKKAGVTIVFISHHLPEVFEVCDRVTILKDGKFIGCYDIGELTEHSMIELMVGRELTELFPPKKAVCGDIIMNLSGFTNHKVRDVSLELHRGEILGIAGLVGAGRTELVRAIIGADKKEGGILNLRGTQTKVGHPKEAIKKGIALVTEDRKMEGLVLGLSVKMNMSLPILDRMKKGIFIDEKKEKALVEGYIKSLKIATPNMDAKVVNLSGGNQQKVVLGKWLAADCDILILDEPTRGIDVGAKIEIYHLMRQLCEQGKSIIMISSELPEVMGMSDRIIVMKDGEVRAVLNEAEVMTEKMIMQYAMG
ncbi:ribose import ATP-binding protein RbsA [Bacteroidia bacterium]|nr:ribose import ATP-binding protein RbsA [Bacteroidia bacterium]